MIRTSELRRKGSVGRQTPQESRYCVPTPKLNYPYFPSLNMARGSVPKIMPNISSFVQVAPSRSGIVFIKDETCSAFLVLRSNIVALDGRLQQVVLEHQVCDQPFQAGVLVAQDP